MNNKNSLTIFFRRLLVPLILFISSTVSSAQEYEGKDTTAIVPPSEERVDEEEPAQGSSYFFRSDDTLSVNQRKIPAKEIDQLKKDENFWYANADIETPKEKRERLAAQEEKGEKTTAKTKEQTVVDEEPARTDYVPIGQRSWFQQLIWVVIIISFIVIVALYLKSSNINLFRRKNVKANVAIDEEEIPEDIFAINYQKEIDRAAEQGNYRLATRLMFLRLLKQLSEKNIIRYKQDKTNLDYLMELHSTAYYKNFFRITRNYEYSWYGLFPVSPEAYAHIRNDFDQFEKGLH